MELFSSTFHTDNPAVRFEKSNYEKQAFAKKLVVSGATMVIVGAIC
jgi:hypothetical protein